MIWVEGEAGHLRQQQGGKLTSNSLGANPQAMGAFAEPTNERPQCGFLHRRTERPLLAYAVEKRHSFATAL